jgi:RND family efflux transporter MFP subunit
MKFTKYFIPISLLCMAVGCTPSAKEDGLGHTHEHHHDGEHDEHSDEIVLTPQQAEQFGVSTTVLAPGEFNDAIKVSGQVVSATGAEGVVTATSLGVVHLSSSISVGATVHKGQSLASISGKGLAGGDVNEAAAVEVEAAKRELERIKPLHADGIVSTSTYNAALRAYESAKAAYSGSKAGGSAIAPIAGVITSLDVTEGQYVEAGFPIATISSSQKLILRADVPERDAAAVRTVSSAKFVTTSSSQVYDLKDLNGRIVTTTAVAGAQQRPGYLPIYFSFDNTGAIISGAYADVYLLTAPRSNVLSVPKEAIVEQQGNHFAYTRLDEEGYQKHKVTLGASDGSNYEIVSGLKAGDEVVTKGAIAVKLAESSGAVPEGHSHNH